MSVKKQQSGPVGYVCSLACNSCWSSEKDFKRHTHTQSHTHTTCQLSTLGLLIQLQKVMAKLMMMMKKRTKPRMALRKLSCETTATICRWLWWPPNVLSRPVCFSSGQVFIDGKPLTGEADQCCLRPQHDIWIPRGAPHGPDGDVPWKGQLLLALTALENWCCPECVHAAKVFCWKVKFYLLIRFC